MLVGSRLVSQDGDGHRGVFESGMIGLSKGCDVVLFLDEFRSTWHDALHVGVFEDFNIVIFVLDGVCIGGIMIFLHNNIERAVSRKVFAN